MTITYVAYLGSQREHKGYVFRAFHSDTRELQDAVVSVCVVRVYVGVVVVEGVWGGRRAVGRGRVVVLLVVVFFFVIVVIVVVVVALLLSTGKGRGRGVCVCGGG